MHKGVSLHFLGWSAPVVRRTATHLCDQFTTHGIADLSGVLVVVSGSRAGRQLSATLIDVASERRVPLFLPRVVTPRGLMEFLVPTLASSATESERWWAWITAMHSLEPSARRAICAREPDPLDVCGWTRLAQLMDRTREFLLGEGATIGLAAKKADTSPDRDRWAALARLESTFTTELSKHGLSDGSMDRMNSARTRLRRPIGPIVIVGVPELPGMARRLLHHVAEDSPVHALVIAPSSFADRFDELGCVRPDRWSDVDLEREVGLTTDLFTVAHNPTDQADEALAIIETWPDCSPHDLLIGSLDAEVADRLTARGRLCGVQIRRAEGRELSRSRAYQLLLAIEEYARAWSFRGLGSVARHADVSRWLVEQLAQPDAAWLPQLDEFAVEHLPRSTRDIDPAHPEVTRIIKCIDKLLGVDQGSVARAEAPLTGWGQRLQQTMASLTGYSDATGPSSADAGYAHVLDILAQIVACRAPEASPRCGFADAVRLVRQQCETARVPEPSAPHAVDMLGWLELLYDDSSTLVLTGLNEGNVPAAGRDTLLPDPLRAALQIPTSDHHAARDCYLLAALSASGRRLRIVCGKVSHDGEPHLPSRLMFSCSNDAVLDRVAIWNNDDRPPPRRPPIGPSSTSSEGSLRVLAPDPSPPRSPPSSPDRMPVTSFRDYLASPYLYYLRHVLRISEISDASSELDAGGFGDLIHTCLGAFGRSEVAGSADAEAIERYLAAELDQTLLSKFGSTPPAAILVQRANARGRLRAFARWQVAHAAEGWSIERVEWSPSQRELTDSTSPSPTTPSTHSRTSTSSGVPFDVDGKDVLLIGRIDRIDRHRDGRVLLLDYKTAKDAKSPEKVHQAGRSSERRWVDLQLPLYRRLAMSVAGVDASVGYVCLPMRAADTSLHLASWDPDDFANAEECARGVIRRIRAGDFFSLGTDPPTEGVMGWLAGTGFVKAPDGETDEGSDA